LWAEFAWQITWINQPGKFVRQDIGEIGPVFQWIKYLGNSALPSHPGELMLAIGERVD
jgi:hypothetical protein